MMGKCQRELGQKYGFLSRADSIDCFGQFVVDVFEIRQGKGSHGKLRGSDNGFSRLALCLGLRRCTA